MRFAVAVGYDGWGLVAHALCVPGMYTVCACVGAVHILLWSSLEFSRNEDPDGTSVRCLFFLLCACPRLPRCPLLHQCSTDRKRQATVAVASGTRAVAPVRRRRGTFQGCGAPWVPSRSGAFRLFEDGNRCGGALGTRAWAAVVTKTPRAIILLMQVVVVRVVLVG